MKKYSANNTTQSKIWMMKQNETAFEDCMSGGFPIYELMICRLLTQDPSINLDNYVYPCGKDHEEKTGRDHYTLLDFLNETQDTKEQF